MFQQTCGNLQALETRVGAAVMRHLVCQLDGDGCGDAAADMDMRKLRRREREAALIRTPVKSLRIVSPNPRAIRLCGAWLKSAVRVSQPSTRRSAQGDFANDAVRLRKVVIPSEITLSAHDTRSCPRRVGGRMLRRAPFLQAWPLRQPVFTTTFAAPRHPPLRAMLGGCRSSSRVCP